MSSKKVIAIIGATGKQGGGLLDSIISDPRQTFSARALTRDTASSSIKELLKKSPSIEVSAADTTDVASLTKAFAGCYGAYLVSMPTWTEGGADKELQQIKNMAVAAKAANLKHVVFSTLEDVREVVPLHDNRIPTIEGKYKVPHFDVKGEGIKFFEELGVPATYMFTSFYWDNFIHLGMGPQKQADGSYTLALPMGDSKMSGIASEDIGRSAFGLFQDDNFIGKKFGIAGEHLTGQEMAAAFSEVLGKKVTYNAIPHDVYRGLGFPGASDIGNMFQYYTLFADQFTAFRDLLKVKAINPKLQDFKTWLQANKQLFKLD